MISLKGCDRSAVLAALYNRARPLGLGLIHYTPEPMTVDEARRLLDNPGPHYFDYVKGRVLKVDLSGDTLDPSLYDRDNGPGAAREALAHLVTEPD